VISPFPSSRAGDETQRRREIGRKPRNRPEVNAGEELEAETDHLDDNIRITIDKTPKNTNGFSHNQSLSSPPSLNNASTTPSSSSTTSTSFNFPRSSSPVSTRRNGNLSRQSSSQLPPTTARIPRSRSQAALDPPSEGVASIDVQEVDQDARSPFFPPSSSSTLTSSSISPPYSPFSSHPHSHMTTVMFQTARNRHLLLLTGAFMLALTFMIVGLLYGPGLSLFPPKD